MHFLDSEISGKYALKKLPTFAATVLLLGSIHSKICTNNKIENMACALSDAPSVSEFIQKFLHVAWLISNPSE
jgi:hypothetical protein